MNELILSKEVYTVRAVQSAAQAFSEICRICINDTSDHIICSFQMRMDIPISQTIGEFENYLIDLTVSGGFYATH